MGGSVPKQYLSLLGEPVLAHTLRAFERSCAEQVVLVVQEGGTEYAEREIIEKYGFRKVFCVTEGGAERFDSVYRGLLQLKDRGIRFAAVQDGARPLVTPEIIERCYTAAEQYGGAAAAVPVKDTIRYIRSDGSAGDTLQRQALRAMQTPQTFDYERLLAAYEKMLRTPDGTAGITDDVMVAERFGGLRAQLVDGDYRNLKITTAEDLEAAENFLKKFEKS